MIPRSEDSLEKEMAIHSSILAWRIPWTQKSGRLQSMGSQESDTAEWLNRHHHLVVQWLGLCAPKAGGLGLIPGQGARAHMLQLRHRATKYIVKKKKKKKNVHCKKDFY